MSHESSLSWGHQSRENERREKVGSVPADRNRYGSSVGTQGISEGTGEGLGTEPLSARQ
jgi:hypothetical protein